MLTEYARDHAFTIAWFGLMAFVWFGWGQEDPPTAWRKWLGAGAALGVLLAGIFGYGVFLRWDDGSALDGRYAWFGLLVGLELLLAAAGCVLLARRGQARWMAWWVALVVALHLVPLAFFLHEPSLAALGVLQSLGLLTVHRRLTGTGRATSRLVGPWMGVSFLAFAAVSAVWFVMRSGAPW